MRAWGALLILAPALAAAELPARGTADVLPPGRWSIGLLDPLRYGAAEGLELATHPVLDLLGTPSLLARRALPAAGPVRLTAEGGLWIPTVGMRLTQGFLVPSWETSESQVGWFAGRGLGVAASTGREHVTTARLDGWLGIPLGENDALPPDTYAPIELAMAPALTGHRLHLGLVHDRALLSWLRARAGAGVWHTGPTDPPRSRFFLAAWAGLDVAVSRAVRIGAGAILYDYDQRRTVVERGDDGRWHRLSVRSRDVWPTLELLVAP